MWMRDLLPYISHSRCFPAVAGRLAKLELSDYTYPIDVEDGYNLAEAIGS